jgi:hypothetical protein
MNSARKPSGFLQQNYDKLIVVVVLSAILISGIILMFQVRGGGTELAATQAELIAQNPARVQPPDNTALSNLLVNLTQPFQVPPAQRRMLVGDLRVSSVPDGLPIPFDAAVCPFTGAAQPLVIRPEDRDTDGDKMPDVWEETYGLNPYDPGDAGADADSDGFTNLEEYQGNSNPIDVADTPPPPAKLRIGQVRMNPFKLRFLGVSKISENEVRYQLNLRTLERTYFPRMNEEVEGYTVISYNEKGPDGPVLSLQQGDKIIHLTQGKVIDEQARTAVLIFLVDGKRMRVNIGEVITLLDREYKVIDISDIRVVIRDEEADKDFEIGLITELERQSLAPSIAPGVAP